MFESAEPGSPVSPRPRRPWTVTAATCLVLTTAAIGLLMAGLTLAIVDASMARGAVAQMESGMSAGYDEHSLDENLFIVKAGVAVWLIVSLLLATVALAAGSGRVLAFRTLIAASVFVYFMACCCCQGPLIDCPFADTCGEQRSGFPTWYLTAMPVLASIQIGVWVSGIALFALPKASRVYFSSPGGNAT